MARGPNHCGTYEYNCKVSFHWAGSVSGRTTGETHDMEVKGPTITAMGLGAPDLQGCADGKQRAERLSELQERRRGLQSLLSARLGELRRVCLAEAELTGEIPREFPLEAGERPPHVRRRSGLAHHAPKHSAKGEEEEVCQRKPKKALFSGALRRQTDSEQHPPQGKRTVHRGCHTDDTVKSESSSMSDSTTQDNEESSSGVTPDGLSPTRPQLAPGSPDSRLSRKLSPVEVYYEMRTRRNSMASSASPSRSLPRSISNVEGRSVPATPLLSRTAPTSVHVRSDVSGGVGGKHWADGPDGTQVLPLQSQEGSSSGGSFERGGCPCTAPEHAAATARRPCWTAPSSRGGSPAGACRRWGPYKSSEALTDGRLRQVHRVSPERHLNGHARAGQDALALARRPLPAPAGSVSSPISTASPSQPPTSAGPPPYSPCCAASPGPAAGQGDAHQVLRALHPAAAAPAGVPPAVRLLRAPLHPPPARPAPPPPPCTPTRRSRCAPAPPCPAAPPVPATTPEDSTRSLHKALALEGLRDWYLRNTLGHPAARPSSRTQPCPARHTPSLHGAHPLPHQPQSFQGEPATATCPSPPPSTGTRCTAGQWSCRCSRIHSQHRCRS
ncbi:hypothetical protein ANANG_G00228440 [Anguilla anguilla]|uniref:Cytohesin Ubiquitin Protein Inducing domain-containing protein n=1 Tax=Anguilla anguilla TaxID=7936 RepID=A0A9D3RTE7_ANGAN|nr:hypothetical protein ANANG_G00228440 [Anguilla anguilla]